MHNQNRLLKLWNQLDKTDLIADILLIIDLPFIVVDVLGGYKSVDRHSPLFVSYVVIDSLSVISLFLLYINRVHVRIKNNGWKKTFSTSNKLNLILNIFALIPFAFIDFIGPNVPFFLLGPLARLITRFFHILRGPLRLFVGVLRMYGNNLFSIINNPVVLGLAALLVWSFVLDVVPISLQSLSWLDALINLSLVVAVVPVYSWTRRKIRNELSHDFNEIRYKSTEELVKALNENESVIKEHPLGDYLNISRYSYLENISKRDPKDVKSEDIEKTVSILSELIWQVNRRLENDNDAEEYNKLMKTNKELNNLRVTAQRSRLKLSFLQLAEILISGLIYVAILWIFYKGLNTLRNDTIYISYTSTIQVWVSEKLGQFLSTTHPVFTLAIGVLGIVVFHIVVKNFLKSIAERTVSLLDDFIVVLVAQPATTILLIELFRYVFIKRQLFGNIGDTGGIVFNITRVLIFAIMGFGLFDGLVIRVLRERAEKTETKLDDDLIEIARRVSLVFIVMVALIFVLSEFTWDQNDLITAIASAIFGGVLIYAGRNFAENMVAGVYLTLVRPFEEGNYIILSEEVFYVEKVDVTTTELYNLNEQTRVVIPNMDLATKSITNLSVPDIQHRLNVHLYVPKDYYFDAQPVLLKTLYLYPDVNLANIRVIKEEMTFLRKEIPTLSKKCSQIETIIDTVQNLRRQLSFYQKIREKVGEQNSDTSLSTDPKADPEALRQITNEISEIKQLAQQLASGPLGRVRARRVLREISKEPTIIFEAKVTDDGWMYTEIQLYFTISSLERQSEIRSSVQLETQNALASAGIKLLPGRSTQD